MQALLAIPSLFHSVKNAKQTFSIILTRCILACFIPVPLPKSIIAYVAPLVSQIVVILAVLVMVLIVTIGSILFSPFLLQGSTVDTSVLKSLELSLPSTDLPQINPLGGNKLSFVNVTAIFHDPIYFLLFGMQHTGVDFVPSSIYFAQSDAYKKTHQVIVYATQTGTANFYVDQYGSHTVEDINPEGNLKSVDMHLNQVFVKTGETLKAGTPVGIMGATGYATGTHLHYEIDVKDGSGKWSPENPLQFITQ